VAGAKSGSFHDWRQSGAREEKTRRRVGTQHLWTTLGIEKADEVDNFMEGSGPRGIESIERGPVHFTVEKP
jgi:hypothetical protein